MPNAWSNIEVQLIIADYFNMLSAELNNEKYSKAEHRRNILPLLNNRSEGSIEFKHQNISASLINLGLPFIKGYLPRYNYQNILDVKIVEYIKQNPEIEKHFIDFTEREEIITNHNTSFDELIVEPPQLNTISEPKAIYKKNPIKVNYLEREQRNLKLGELGEELVVNYEKWRLVLQGKESYAEQVRWISKEEGDGAGFDILSKKAMVKTNILK